MIKIGSKVRDTKGRIHTVVNITDDQYWFEDHTWLSKYSIEEIDE